MVYWDRPTLKARAKQVLRMPGIYWMSVLFMLVYTLFSGGTAVASAGGSSSTATTGAYGSMQEDHIAEAFGEHQETMLRVLPVMAFVAIVLIAIGIAYTIFASNIITVGKNRYFIDCRSGKANFGSLFWGFRQGRYMATVKAMFGYTVR
ncbi:MAG: hypothetical protein RR009_06515, partial [Oscillospiraceae bacterium]